MDENSGNDQHLIARIRQLENERDELRKDIEQLCMQQAGPGYLGVATRMHFQRTAGLEQEIENLKRKLAVCTRENQNLQEELTEVYHIKSQLADLHSSEISKNAEAEKQLKFFQSCVAGAFAERDAAIMEAEKAKEKEEIVSHELSTLQTRIEELTTKLFQENELVEAMRIDHDTRERQTESSRKVIDKFYAIRQESLTINEDVSWEDKCECLLHDSTDLWSFRCEEENSVSKYISALEQELETLRRSRDNFEKNLRMGMAIENHLKRRIRILEKEKEKSKKAISALHDYHFKHRSEVVKLLDECDSFIKSSIGEVEEKIRQLELSSELNLKVVKAEDTDACLDESECRDVHVNNEIALDSTVQKDDPGLLTTTTVCVDTSTAFSQALQEKVAALLLLSQEEERHLLERNVNVALQRKVEELQRNLLQVTHEKVKALMEFAQLKQEYQILQEKIKQGKSYDEIGQKRMIPEKDGRLKNLLKKTYLAHWVEKTDPEGEGPMYYNGVYHLFYQYNPKGAVWGNIVWAHSVSKDLINWTPLKPAIFPSKTFDKYGCWSGSATVLPGNKPIILYTGIIDINNTQVQNYAIPANYSDPNLEEWIKPDDNPLIVAEIGVNKTAFRDPTTAWMAQDGHWRIAIGGRRKERGVSWLYRSKDFKKWVKAKHPLHSVAGTGNWECPDFYPVAMEGQNGLDTSVMAVGGRWPHFICLFSGGLG